MLCTTMNTNMIYSHSCGNLQAFLGHCHYHQSVANSFSTSKAKRKHKSYINAKIQPDISNSSLSFPSLPSQTTTPTSSIMSSSSDPPAHKPTVTSTALHTMGASLIPYLDMKVHHLIPSHRWKEIEVTGHHTRSAPAIIYNGEKNDKLFNTQRPTATILEGDKLRINCFPGRDYVKHYANIIATHLAIEGRDPEIVKVVLPEVEDGYEVFLKSNLRGLATEKTNLVIVGSFPEDILSLSEPWSGRENTDELFAWQTSTRENGFKATILKCRVCFWGDLAGQLVRCLKEICGASLQCVIYVGKLGTLAEEHMPNLTLATGSSSYVRGEFIEWENPISEEILGKEVQRGVHFTSASVLDEDQVWFEKFRERFCWVEPEIGHMAFAAMEMMIRFGYLHIVSNNLAGKFEYDLGNEREVVVLRNRDLMNEWIGRILNDFVEDLDRKLTNGA
ncbi:995605b9-6fd9-4cf6-b619-dafd23f9e2d5-CDS [Sclerotinia trifoliorum]|uniref:995605b9-6fd9-4cf6-b619-dafd23f9e2d5-CDS n=1 Tax=Sclerotinia trifoliorum TaxID=28548 RepID=A0A8H2VZN5_9HELO|nr:995605b9-6fd9-4cf6-b619-dafd23f9e2d5-CDS [Sclerotinia trifoliorum]